MLVVEDERRLAAAVRRGLVAEGFAVNLAHNGEDGLHAAREGGYDAVVLDLMLPKISGYKICQQLRAEENWVPILILSAKDGEYDQADGLDLGADDYLTKPFSYVVLAARLRALLRRGAIPRPAQLRAGDLVLDPATRRVRRGETDIELTAREFALLEYLMRRPGQVVAKTELLEHVWESYDSLDLNVVEVYAGYVRRKIDAPFGGAPCRRCAGRATAWPPTAADRAGQPRPGLSSRPRSSFTCARGLSGAWKRRSARSLMPRSILRSMIRLPGSMTYVFSACPSRDAPPVAIRFLLISLVPSPSGTRQKAQTQFPSSERNTSHRSGSSSATRRMGPRLPSRCLSPTSRCWYSGRIRSALCMPRPMMFSIQS